MGWGSKVCSNRHCHMTQDGRHMFLYGKRVKQWIFQKLLQSMISKLVADIADN